MCHFQIDILYLQEVNASTGTFDPMLVRFSDQEDFTNFTVTATNTAGDQRLEVAVK